MRLFKIINIFILAMAASTESNLQAVVVHQGDLARPMGAYVGLMAGSSAIPLGRYYVLTAKHVNVTTTSPNNLFYMFDASNPNGGLPSYAVATYPHPDPLVDLKIVKLNNPLPYYSRLYENTVIPGTSIRVGGWGFNAGEPTANGYLWNYNQTEKWGMNDVIVDSDTISRSNLKIYFRNTPHSAVAARQDSGGGFFVQEDGAWKLAGIITTATGSGQSRFDWDYARAYPIKNYINWIRGIVPEDCAGDANGDDLTNGSDLSVLLSRFGQNISAFTSADFNGDALINGADLAVLLANFGCGTD